MKPWMKPSFDQYDDWKEKVYLEPDRRKKISFQNE